MCKKNPFHINGVKEVMKFSGVREEEAERQMIGSGHACREQPEGEEDGEEEEEEQEEEEVEEMCVRH